jgi:methyl-accepting chemotaxis protein
MTAMHVGGDAQEVRALARRVRGWADDVDRQAAVLRATDVEWHSTAADDFARRLEERRGDVLAVAEKVRTAADRIDHLADVLQERQQQLSDLLAAAGRTLADAEQMVRDGVGDLLSEARSLAEGAADLVDQGRDALGALALGVTGR